MHRRTSPSHAPSTSYVRQGQTFGASLTRAEVEELLLDQRTLIEIHLCTIKLEIIQHVIDEFVKVRDFISTLVPPSLSRSTPPMAQAANEPTVLGSLLHDRNGGEIDPVPKCVEPQVHGRGISRLLVDQDEDMDKEMQERNGGAGMEFEPPMNSDDDEVASDGSGKREDDRVASPTGVVEAKGGCGMDFESENNSDDDEVPSGGSGNRQDKPIAYTSGVAEVDGK
ncbi:39S ribosomal protein L41-A, mitochondrial [Olea europaea subsp. europaea]|uniref:39S ribosomal protein L41-A, mitochondrial n=1 Tax=Olea europaea subsp. europaea TaxID=158383 RepID=A0A8S0QGG4_OLEEU|nr:39S ribosomal protein L41-A, mitochondrial [Olea europaea subsp. europaea]